MSTSFPIVPDNAQSSLAANYTLGSGSLTMVPGDGSKFGTPSPTAPVYIVVVSQTSNHFTIYSATGRSGDTLTGLTVLSGTLDRNYVVGDSVSVRVVGEHYKIVYDAVAAIEDSGLSLPSQATNSGKFLTTDGTNLSWATVSGGGTSLPTQTSQGGKFLTTNGTVASWAAITANTLLPTQTSNGGKVLTTDGTNTAWSAITANSLLPNQATNSGKFLTTDGTSVSWASVSGSGAGLPSQTSQTGKFLSTDGTDPLWAPITIDGLLPSQTSQSGKFLVTNGTISSWAAILVDNLLPTQTSNSGKFLTTNGTASSWAAITANGLLPSQASNSGKFLTTDGTNLSWNSVSGGGGAVTLAPGNSTINTIQATGDFVGLTIEAFSGQTNPLLQFANSSGVTQSQFSAAGYFGYGIAPTMPIQARGSFDTDLVKFDSPTGLGSFNGFTIRPCDSARRASLVAIDAMALTWGGADLVLGNNFAETQYRQQRLANASSGNAFGHRFVATANSDLAGTATLTAFSFELTDNSTTSGAKKFVDFKVGGASKSGLDLSGRFVMAVSTTDPVDTPAGASAVFNTTNNKLWIYNPVSAAWKSVTLA